MTINMPLTVGMFAGPPPRSPTTPCSSVTRPQRSARPRRRESPAPRRLLCAAAVGVHTGISDESGRDAAQQRRRWRQADDDARAVTSAAALREFFARLDRRPVTRRPTVINQDAVESKLDRAGIR